MTSTDQDFTLVAGNNPTLSFTVRDADGNVLNLTGATAAWSMWAVAATAAAIDKATGGDGITIPTPASGVVLVALDEADSLSLAQGLYLHQLEITDAAGKIHTASRGRVTVLTNLN